MNENVITDVSVQDGLRPAGIDSNIVTLIETCDCYLDRIPIRPAQNSKSAQGLRMYASGYAVIVLQEGARCRRPSAAMNMPQRTE